MTVTIRPFTEADYPAYTRLKNRIYPEYARPEEIVRHADDSKDPLCRTQRFVAEQAGRIIGAGEFTQNPWVYHPHHFEVNCQVHPDYRRQGTGRALYQHVLQALVPYQPQQLRAEARQDQTGGVAFCAHFGFVEVEQEWEYLLDPAGYDFTPYSGLEERLAAQGIHIFTMAHLMAHEPEHREKLYALDTGNGPPEAAEVTMLPFDRFVEEVLDPAVFIPDAFFVAVKDGRYIGMSNLESIGRTDRFQVGFTGVEPAFRRQGIALALKLRTIQYATAHGNPSLITSSIYNNRPMLALNEKLGFTRRAIWIRYHKDLHTT